MSKLYKLTDNESTTIHINIEDISAIYKSKNEVKTPDYNFVFIGGREFYLDEDEYKSLLERINDE